ncbi:two-component system regulatory protein YycI [Fusibacter ferrireducens]|uniref:Regulatory protein YycH-like domain-containing protein n=1 Tax=Fusibacter ferrireducens TaxID=2785058 RepID=A0ABR9ZTU1_9FIRM|nr:hypothetical protein [Fusibacter ferrireducens]MBF4693300.1 hypothetical protein [Fusibacter ferrireducens]
MDWPRIKTILIMVLLVTNILLGVMIVNEQKTFQREQSEKIDNIRALYEKRGITILPMSLKFPDKIESLNVEYDTYGESELRTILGDDYEYDGSRYLNRDEMVLLTGTTLEYFVNIYRPQEDLFDIEITTPFALLSNGTEIKSVCDDFLKALNMDQDYVFEHYKTEGQLTYICVKQIYKDYFLDDSSMIFVIKDKEIVGFKRKWLNILDNNAQSKYPIISIDKALYELMMNFKEEDVISEIAIGYKLNDSSLLVSDLVSGEALPYYKIKLEAGKCYYVQAVSETQ